MLSLLIKKVYVTLAESQRISMTVELILIQLIVATHCVARWHQAIICPNADL